MRGGASGRAGAGAGVRWGVGFGFGIEDEDSQSWTAAAREKGEDITEGFNFAKWKVRRAARRMIGAAGGGGERRGRAQGAPAREVEAAVTMDLGGVKGRSSASVVPA